MISFRGSKNKADILESLCVKTSIAPDNMDNDVNQKIEIRLMLIAVKCQQESEPIAVNCRYFTVTNSFIASVR